MTVRDRQTGFLAALDTMIEASKALEGALSQLDAAGEALADVSPAYAAAAQGLATELAAMFAALVPMRRVAEEARQPLAEAWGLS